MHKKLNNKGFSLAELLLTILILSLAGITMTGGFTLVHNSYTKISQKANGETLLSTTIYKVNSYLRYAEDVSTTSTGVKFTDVNTGYIVELTNADNSNTSFKGLVLNYYSGDTVVQTHQLLSNSAMNDRLTPRIKNITLDKGLITFTMEILNKDNTSIASQEITIDLINSNLIDSSE